ncbi:MAG: hypothetical protein CMK23_01225 [Porticoccaceae bacterium]|nr:hypothetical protein [Porticoccaceae bacterium]|tara:strand:+ start:263 stop:586 length:324 start_codon:yes stop_codon:yes gene_type:complete
MVNIQEAPYSLDINKDTQEAIDKQLGSLIGETVCVSWTKIINANEDIMLGSRKHFEPQISVQGTLEGNEETGRYRVLVDDNNYSYFYNDSVWSMGQDVGKRAIIFIL